MVFYNMQFNSCSGGSKDNSMSYIEFKEQENEAFQHLNANDFHITNIMVTMHHLYHQGEIDADTEWRNALAIYCNNHNISCKDVFCEIVNILNKN